MLDLSTFGLCQPVSAVLSLNTQTTWGGGGESDITVLCVMGVVGMDNYFANCLGRRVRLFFYFFREEMQVADVFKLWQNKQLI